MYQKSHEQQTCTKIEHKSVEKHRKRHQLVHKFEKKKPQIHHF